MRKLLEKALKLSDQAEVYGHSYDMNVVSFQNARLQDIESSMQTGVSLRLIKDGKLGFAYTRNLNDRDELIQNALASLNGQVAAVYDFPLTEMVPGISAADGDLSGCSSSNLVDEGSRICDSLKSQTDADIRAELFTTRQRVELVNSAGTDLSAEDKRYGAFATLGFPGSGSRFLRLVTASGFAPMPDESIAQLVRLYRTATRNVVPKSGRMKVLFMPNSLITFLWRLSSGLSGRSVDQKTSPIAYKMGERIISEQITFSDDPLDISQPLARAFDDEGVACKKLTLIDKGILKAFFTDIKYAQKLGARSTGHGYRTELWGGEPGMLTPLPALAHPRIAPGSADFNGLLKLMGTGLIVEGALGFHSGNIPNGDFSVGANPGFWVENGEIVGRVKDAMVSGNVYETLQDVIAVGKPAIATWAASIWDSTVVPALLCDNVRVATQSS